MQDGGHRRVQDGGHRRWQDGEHRRWQDGEHRRWQGGQPRRRIGAISDRDGACGCETDGRLTLFGDDAGPEAAGSITSAPSRRIRLLVAYDGSEYRGFAAQPGTPTVGGALATALERFLRHTVQITCAGRTDAGVHAWGQVVSFDARDDAEPAAIQKALNRTLRPWIVVRSAEVAPEGFDARRWATERRYRYSVLNTPAPDPFVSRTAWHVPAPLDLAAMRLACDPLLGEHDFSSFCRRPSPDASMVRIVRDARWVDQGDGLLRFEIAASAFCHQMVRSVVGTLVDVGRGKRRAGDMSAIIASRSRASAGQPAPPHGLCLWDVEYDQAAGAAQPADRPQPTGWAANPA